MASPVGIINIFLTHPQQIFDLIAGLIASEITVFSRPKCLYADLLLRPPTFLSFGAEPYLLDLEMNYI